MYKLIRQRRKSIVIEIDSGCDIIVKAPLQISKAEIDKLVKQKEAWIEKALENKRRVQQEVDWVQNEKILYLGEYRSVCVCPIAKGKNKIEYKQGIFYIYTVDASKENLHKMMYVWMKKQAYTLCTELSEYYAKEIGYSYEKISIRNQKTRWGSCSSKKNISYNIRMMGAPKDKIEYIILHEVMHLKHFNHGPLFWQDIEKIMPDYKEKQAYFKNNGMLLQI
jgi:hypothetical protein